MRDVFLWLRTSGLRLVVIAGLTILLVRLLAALTGRIARLARSDSPLSELEKRARTLAGLLKTVGTTIILVVALLMGLREIGFDITPLLAGAGVAGLAIGFGAQSLIKDVIAGFFILLEDQFHVGDVIQAAGVSGQVEQLSLRTTSVRDLQGTAHFIPNGEIKVVSNLTKGWSRVALEIGVAHEADLDQTLKILGEEARLLAADAAIGPLLLEPPQVLGVEAITDAQVMIRVLVKTSPARQWEVARDLRRRVKLRFDREQIPVPYPHRVVLTRSDEPARTSAHSPEA
jgi:small conductance mechanosensitive channel